MVSLHIYYSVRVCVCKTFSQVHELVQIMSLFFICSFLSLLNKSFKNEKGHAGHTWRYWSKASAHSACCRSLLYSCATVYLPSPSSAACFLCTLIDPLLPASCFFSSFFWVKHHTQTVIPKILRSQVSLINEVASLHQCLFVYVFNPYSQWVCSDGLFCLSSCCCFSSLLYVF